MGWSVVVREYGDPAHAHMGIAMKLKMLMNDLIDLTYKNRYPKDMIDNQFKRFSIFCTEESMESRLGDCFYNKDKSSSIRILCLGKDADKGILITTIHEVSHHIEFSLHGNSGHGKEFYRIHKELLYTAFDMGILKLEDITIDKITRGRNKNKLARMMDDYVPKQINYKKDVMQVFVYNGFPVKEQLKNRDYKWNSLDRTWRKTIPAMHQEEECSYLKELGLKDTDIHFRNGNEVIMKLSKEVRIYNVPYEARETMKQLGYRFDYGDRKESRNWHKKIIGDVLSDQEKSIILSTGRNIRIQIQNS